MIASEQTGQLIAVGRRGVRQELVTLFAWVLFALLLGGVVVNLVNSAAIAVLLPNEERATSLAALAIINKIIGGPVTAGVIAWMAMLFQGPMALGVTLTWLGVISGLISLVGYWFAMRNAPLPASAIQTPVT